MALSELTSIRQKPGTRHPLSRRRVAACCSSLLATAGVMFAAGACSQSSASGAPTIGPECGQSTTDCTPTDTDAANGDDGGGADGGLVGDSAVDSADVDLSDPCLTPGQGSPPITRYYFDCSGQCVKDDLFCNQVKCQPNAQAVGAFNWSGTSSMDRYVFRTPDRPGRDPACPTCTGDSIVYAMEFEISGTHFSVSIDPPWYVYGPFTARSKPTFCPEQGMDASACLRDQSTAMFVVATTDPDAPARNGYVQYFDACFH